MNVCQILEQTIQTGYDVDYEDWKTRIEEFDQYVIDTYGGNTEFMNYCTLVFANAYDEWKNASDEERDEICKELQDLFPYIGEEIGMYSDINAIFESILQDEC